MLKKGFILFLLLIFNMIGVLAATSTPKAKSPYTTKAIEVQTADNHIMKAKVMYPKPPKNVKGVSYPTVILLHSLGYCSTQWGTLPESLLKQGYAVLLVDLRGHGTSCKDAKFRIKSWTYFTEKTYKKYPSDVIAIINQTKQTTKRVSFNNYSIIGGDIGANTAVLVAQKMFPKPKSLVLLTPSVEMKGLTIATLHGVSAISDIGNAPIMVMCSKNDKYSINQENLLKKFVKGQYIVNNVDTNKNGMLIVRNDAKTVNCVIAFLNKNMKPVPTKK